MTVVLQDGTNTYVYGLDLISATDGAGAQTYFTYDGLGSTTDLTNGAGAVTGQYTYDVFGAVRSQTGGGSNYWQFTGEQKDGDSGLAHLRKIGGVRQMRLLGTCAQYAPTEGHQAQPAMTASACTLVMTSAPASPLRV
jgi:hypothetical protein